MDSACLPNAEEPKAEPKAEGVVPLEKLLNTDGFGPSEALTPKTLVPDEPKPLGVPNTGVDFIPSAGLAPKTLVPSAGLAPKTLAPSDDLAPKTLVPSADFAPKTLVLSVGFAPKTLVPSAGFAPEMLVPDEPASDPNAETGCDPSTGLAPKTLVPSAGLVPLVPSEGLTPKALVPSAGLAPNTLVLDDPNAETGLVPSAGLVPKALVPDEPPNALYPPNALVLGFVLPAYGLLIVLKDGFDQKPEGRVNGIGELPMPDTNGLFSTLAPTFGCDVVPLLETGVGLAESSAEIAGLASGEGT